MTTADHVTVNEDDSSVTATAVVDAPAAVIFDLLRRPAEHARISGDSTVQGVVDGPELLEQGSRFGMRMKIGVPYRVHSKVVEYEPGRTIAWSHFGGHRWRWRVEPNGDFQTTVSETFDLSTSKLPWALRLGGYPHRHRDNVVSSVANLKRLAEGA